MRKAGSIYGILLAGCFLITAFSVRAQTKPANIWATVQFNKQRVAVGEPLMVTITVYTSTWFTAPPEFGEIQVPEAMMVEYQQRTGSVRKTIGNKSYPAVERKYVVYPFRVGENRLPALSIEVESPPEGDYKGKRSVIKSPERMFTVLPLPDSLSLENWFTAFHVDLSERWDKPMDHLKQGDVRERQIIIRADGALAALIPPLELGAGSFGNVYSNPASLENIQGQSSFTGTRTERWTYLMEKEGTHRIPGIQISWYDPGSGQLERAELADREITVAGNPNLDFLLSMQDSLQALLEGGTGMEEKEPFKWLGLNWWQLMVVAGSIGAIILILIRIVRTILHRRKEKRIATMESEKRYFEEILKVKSGGAETMMRALMLWYDRFRGDRYGPELAEFICDSGDPELSRSFSLLEKVLYAGADPSGWDGAAMTVNLTKARKKAVSGEAVTAREDRTVLNPSNDESSPCTKRE